jgi:hypothetical protein
MATPLETIRKKAKELQAVKNISYQAALKKAGADYRAGKLSGTKKTTKDSERYKKTFGKVGKFKEVKKVKHCVNVAGVKVPRTKRSELQIANDLLKSFKSKVEKAKTTTTKNNYKRQYNRVYDVIEHLKKYAD